jgi:hypothetical protein
MRKRKREKKDELNFKPKNKKVMKMKEGSDN